MKKKMLEITTGCREAIWILNCNDNHAMASQGT